MIWMKSMSSFPGNMDWINGENRELLLFSSEATVPITFALLLNGESE